MSLLPRVGPCVHSFAGYGTIRAVPLMAVVGRFEFRALGAGKTEE